METAPWKLTRWYTAMPMPYQADGRFFDRDAGLVCMGLRSRGIDSKLVLLDGEAPDPALPLITTTRPNMGNASWWKTCGAGGVVLNSWGGPRYEDIARAIYEAGLRLVVRLDSNGIKSPVAYFPQYVSREYSWYRDLNYPLPAVAALGKAVLFRYFRGLHDESLLRHLSYADVIGIESPLARECLVHVLGLLGGDDLAHRIRVIPHPVLDAMAYEPQIPKKKIIVAAGRWEAFIKDAPMLDRVLRRILKQEPGYRARIAGSGGDVIRQNLDSWPKTLRERVEYVGEMAPGQMPAFYKDAQVMLVTSRWESFCIAAAEAVCCGCSIAALGRIASMNYFASHASGSLAPRRRTDALAGAVLNEINAWREGARDPQAISEYWRHILHPTTVADAVLGAEKEPHNES
ncbi:MAG: glycosyltransferase family 4 protein [bacterium]